MEREAQFQARLKKEIQARFPGAIVRKEDPCNSQGFPDLLILFPKKPGESMGRWATLEVKREANARHRPNQDTWIDILNKMSFARFIFPENKSEVLNDLERSFKA